ncbi:MFS transporter [Gordonia pseudamarae]|uniref:MFS transporter n=1 Tax=Gordonia pseudamarae TaxID=2831662 RepID=A0ABX6ILU5_9ACTN|nr:MULTISPECIES: MFS transporter [Gordonia]MBD0021911.1 MFS transporter [Gordonia sp. (in: high G+C Gram-positive bacteria)]QHN28014.1 MFS transporter [Gordonia pseudamarae]QHN36893.1 MFS transporter [Gordonia pseudamarae]
MMTTPPEIRRAQTRTLTLLCAGQILGGVSTGTSLALAGVAGAKLSGSETFAGLPGTATTLGAAAVALPLAAAARRRGRRPALAGGFFVASVGALLAALAIDLHIFALFLVAMAMCGCGGAVSLQARFAATDLSAPGSAGRDLSLVVWMTTVGAVIGPSITGVGADLAHLLGIADLAGPFVIGAGTFLLAGTVLAAGLRPDPLLIAHTRTPAAPRQASSRLGEVWRTVRASAASRNGFVALLSTHAVMVGAMSLTPVHLAHGGATLNIIGLSVSAHLAGMYALSPLMGLAADRFGRVPLMLAGQAVLLASCVVGLCFAGTEHHGAGTRAGLVVAMALVGLGWSATTVAASTLLSESVPDRTRLGAHGLADSSMGLAAAVAGALAGVVVGVFGYGALMIVVGVGVLATAGYLLLDRTGQADRERADTMPEPYVAETCVAETCVAETDAAGPHREDPHNEGPCKRGEGCKEWDSSRR